MLISLAAQDARETDEPYLRHVVRYLETLVIPLTASRIFQSTAKKLKKVPLRAYLAEIDPGPLSFTQDYGLEFRRKFSDLFTNRRENENAQQLFKGWALNPIKMNTQGTVHAEAAMMSLAWAAWNSVTIAGIDSNILNDLKEDVFQVRLSRAIWDACIDVT